MPTHMSVCVDICIHILAHTTVHVYARVNPSYERVSHSPNPRIFFPPRKARPCPPTAPQLRALQVGSASSSRRRLRQRLQSRPKVGKPAGAGAALPPHALAEAEERAKAAEAELMQWIEAELEGRRARPSGRI